MTNSADPDQLADQDLHYLLRQGMSCSAREGLICDNYIPRKLCLCVCVCVCVGGGGGEYCFHVVHPSGCPSIRPSLCPSVCLSVARGQFSWSYCPL